MIPNFKFQELGYKVPNNFVVHNNTQRVRVICLNCNKEYTTTYNYLSRYYCECLGKRIIIHKCSKGLKISKTRARTDYDIEKNLSDSTKIFEILTTKNISLAFEHKNSMYNLEDLDKIIQSIVEQN